MNEERLERIEKTLEEIKQLLMVAPIYNTKKESSEEKQTKPNPTAESYRAMDFETYVKHMYDKAMATVEKRIGRSSNVTFEQVRQKIEEFQTFKDNWEKFKGGDNNSRPTFYWPKEGFGLHHLKFSKAGDYAQKFRRKK